MFSIADKSGVGVISMTFQALILFIFIYDLTKGSAMVFVRIVSHVRSIEI